VSVTAAELMVRIGADASSAQQSIASFRSGLNQTAADLGRTGAYLSAAVSAPIIAIGMDALSTASNFQQAMANVGAVSRATESELELLTKAARDLGATTSFSASEAAEGMTFLAMAGFDVNQTISAMPGLLAAAAASGTDLGTTADIVSNILSGFNIEAENTEEVANILTATFTRANTDLTQLGFAMSYVAPQARSMGISIEETAAAIGLLSDAGVQGTRAGTGLNGVLLRLGAPTTAAAEAMEELGISVFDTEGKLKSLPAIMREFERGLDGMTDQQRTQALSNIFDSRALSSFNILLAAGSDNLEEFASTMDSVAAADVAAAQLNTLEGQVKLLNSAMEGLKITVVTAVLPSLQDFVSRVAPMISRVSEWFERLDRNGQMAIFTFVGIAAAAGPVMLALAGIAAGVAFLLSPIGAVVAATALLGAAWAADFGRMRTGAGVVVETVQALAGGFQLAREVGLDPFNSALAGVYRALTSLGLEGAAERVLDFRMAAAGAWETVTTWAGSLATIPEPLMGVADGLSVATNRLSSYVGFLTTTIRESETFKDALIRIGQDMFAFASLRVIVFGELVSRELAPVLERVQTISGWMQSAASGDLTPLKDALNDSFDAIRSFDMAEFVGSLSTAGAETRTAILSSFGELDMPALRDDIITKLGLGNIKLFGDGEETGLGDLPQDMGRLSFAIDAIREAIGRISTIDWGGFELFQSDNALTRFFDRARETASTISANLSDIGSVPPVERFNRAVQMLTAAVNLVGETRTDAIQTGIRHLTRFTTTVLSAASDLVAGLDAEQLATTLGEMATNMSSRFAAVFQDEELFDIGEAAGNLASTVVTKLGEVLGSPTFGEDIGTAVGNATVALTTGAQALASGIVSSLSETDWAQFEANLSTFTTGFIRGVSTSLEQADYGSIASSIVDGISGWLAGRWRESLGAPMTELEQGLGIGLFAPSTSGGSRGFGGGDGKEVLGLPVDVNEAIDGEWSPRLAPDFQLPDVPSPYQLLPDEFYPPVLVPRESYEPQSYYPAVPEPEGGSSWWPDIAQLSSSWWPGIPAPVWLGVLLGTALTTERRIDDFERDAGRLYSRMHEVADMITSSTNRPSTGGGGFGDPELDPDYDPNWVPFVPPWQTAGPGDGRSMAMAGSGGVTVEFSGPVTIANNMDIEMLTHEIATRLKRNMRG